MTLQRILCGHATCSQRRQKRTLELPTRWVHQTWRPTSHQLSLEEALAAREEGMDRVLAWAGDYKEALYAAIEQLAATDDIWCADDVREIAGPVPAGTHYNLIGAVMGAARKRGLIEYVGYTVSTRKAGHANRIIAFRGARS